MKFSRKFSWKKALQAILILLLLAVVVLLSKHIVRKNIFNENIGNTTVSFFEKKLVTNLNQGTGLEFGHASRIWLNSLDGYSGVYNGNGEMIKTKTSSTTDELTPLNVKIPGTPTGMVFYDDNDAVFEGNSFIFPTMEGKIYGWSRNKKTNLEPLVANLRIDNSTSSASYTGITSAKTKDGWRLYVADSKNNKVDIFDENYLKINNENTFIDKSLDTSYSVFNLKQINDNIYVTYKKANGDKGGVINIFDLDGNFVKRLVTDGELNSPYGLAIAPSNFGNVSNLLLVGNISDGEINAYDSVNGKFITKFKNNLGDTLKIDGLNTLTFGTNNGAGRSNELFVSTKTGFSKLEMILDKNNNSNNQIINENNLSDQEKIEKEFLEQNDFKINYWDFKSEIYKTCIQKSDSCLDELYLKKQSELNFLYNKIFSDTKIIQRELFLQNLDGEKIKKLNDLMFNLKNIDPKKWIDASNGQCFIYANNYYAGITFITQQKICSIYRIENWLKELYTLRSIFIRVELGPLGAVQSNNVKIQTQEFSDLIKEEESRVEKSY